MPQTPRLHMLEMFNVLRRSIAVGAMIALAVASLAQRAISEERDPNVIEEFALAPRGSLPVVPVTIQGKEYSFFVDTGSTVNVFDPALAHLLTRSETQDGGNYEMYECTGAVIGASGMELARRTTVVTLETFRRFSKLDVRGIVGMNTLRDKRLQLDFDSDHLRFLKSGREAGGAQLDLGFTSSATPTLTMKIPRTVDVEFTIDTGKCGGEFGYVDEELFEWLVQTKQLEKKSGLILDSIFHEEWESPIGVLSTQSCGPLTWKGGVYSVGRINSVGLGFLSQYVVTFDFPESTLHLAPRKNAVSPQIVNESGLQVVTVDEIGLYVFEADPSGLGFAAGIRSGDTILEIDSTPIRDLPLIAVKYQLRNPSKNCLVDFKSRESGRRTVVDLAALREKQK